MKYPLEHYIVTVTSYFGDYQTLMPLLTSNISAAGTRRSRGGEEQIACAI